MKRKNNLLNTALPLVVGLVLLVCVLLKALIPAVVLPLLTISNMAALSLMALLLDHYFGEPTKRSYLLGALVAGLSFGLLPVAAGFALPVEGLKLSLAGAMVFNSMTFLFTSIQNRLSTGPKANAAPILTALGLYLATGAFQGML